MPTQWTLSYPITEEPMQQRCRLHFESLQKDSFVESVRFENPAHLPNIRLLHVTFKPGATQPWMPSLRHLDLQFGAAVLQAAAANQEMNFSPPPLAIEGDRSSQVGFEDSEGVPIEEFRIMKAMREARQATQDAKPFPVSPEYSANDDWKRGVPHWCQVGRWIADRRTDAAFEVITITPATSVIVSIREWRQDRILSMPLTAIRSDFHQSNPPKEPETWQLRLMSEDAF